MSSTKSINNEIRKLKQERDAESISGKKYFDLAHELHLTRRSLSGEELPAAHLKHENAKVTLDKVYYTDQLTGHRYYLDSNKDRVYIEPEMFSFLKETFSY